MQWYLTVALWSGSASSMLVLFLRGRCEKAHTSYLSECIRVSVWVATAFIYMGKAEQHPKLRIFLSANTAHVVGLKSGI